MEKNKKTKKNKKISVFGTKKYGEKKKYKGGKHPTKNILYIYIYVNNKSNYI